VKAWFNEAGNWCFEFEKDEHEADRLIFVLGEGIRSWRTNHRGAFISASLLHACFEEIFIAQNNKQLHPTQDKPMIERAEEMARSSVHSAENYAFNAEAFDLTEIMTLKKALADGTIKDLL
jgi:hypothetical protein